MVGAYLLRERLLNVHVRFLPPSAEKSHLGLDLYNHSHFLPEQIYRSATVSTPAAKDMDGDKSTDFKLHAICTRAQYYDKRVLGGKLSNRHKY